MGRTQLQDAVPMRLGQSFRAFTTAISRDERRIQRTLSDMRAVNMGATAIDTAINANYKFNRAITGACLAVGAKLKIQDKMGADVLNENDELTELIKEQCAKLVGKDRVIDNKEWKSSSTDFGDISALVPAVNIYVDGARGTLHGSDYYTPNTVDTCIKGAYAEVATLIELLKDGGKKAYEIKANYSPVYSSVENYLQSKLSINKSFDAISYDGDKIGINL